MRKVLRASNCNCLFAQPQTLMRRDHFVSLLLTLDFPIKNALPTTFGKCSGQTVNRAGLDHWVLRHYLHVGLYHARDFSSVLLSSRLV